ncbi:hypothetical protein BKA63DRAFT_558569 [Paraphoma chrysanthemicola]|nr:hypothetical protein BKA63DRAFT_558569 [Paraphoma chrysanthemicola]
MSNQILETLASRVSSRPRQVPVQGCKGEYIGPINLIYHCWVATGPHRDLFYSQLKDSILRLLDGWSASLSSEDFVILSLYMIGRSERTASPTICFISANERNRKEARALVKESGLLKGYPGFKTSHMSKDPAWGAELEQLGTEKEHLAADDASVFPKEAYYEFQKPVNMIGMPVYARHASTMRAATANAIELRGRLYFLTVSHVFMEAQTAAVAPVAGTNIDFEIDSDEETDDLDEMETSVTSLGSLSSDGNSNDASSSEEGLNYSYLESILTVNEAPSVPSITPGIEEPIPSIKKDSRSQDSTDQNLTELLPPQANREKYTYSLLGIMYDWSREQDWALIDVPVFDKRRLKREQKSLSPARISALVASGLQIVAYTASRGKISGTVVGNPSFMRVPQGERFQQVHAIRLNGSLTQGDCGSAVFEATKQNLVGIIVAGCRPSGMAYIVPATDIVADVMAFTGTLEG